MDDALIRIMHGAELADSLSASRRKRIDLVCKGEGIRVDGAYWSAAGTRATRHSVMLGWPSILDSESALTDAIRLMDDQLTAHWRADGE